MNGVPLFLGCLIGVAGLSLALPARREKLSTHPAPRTNAYRWLIGLLLVCLGLLFYMAGYLLIQGFIQEALAIHPALSAFLMALLAMALLNPAMEWGQRKLLTSLQEEKPDLVLTLSELNHRLSQHDSLAELPGAIQGFLDAVLGAQQSFLFLVESKLMENGRSGLRLCISGDDDEVRTVDLQAGSPLAEAFSSYHRAFTLAELQESPAWTHLLPVERAWLVEINCQAFVPIHHHKDWTGLLALGPRGNGRGWESELELLGLLGVQIALALENARLLEGLDRLNNEFRRAYQAQDQAHRRLERLDRTKSDFINLCSRELRGPLTEIQQASHLLAEDGRNGSEQRRLLETVAVGARRLDEILEGMLEMSRIDAHTLVLAPEPVSLHIVFQSLAGELHAVCQEQQLQLTLHGLTSLPMIEADPKALRKVFYQLLSNAVQFTPPGGQVQVGGRRLAPGQIANGGGVEIIVRDSGIGIDPRFHEQIFARAGSRPEDPTCVQGPGAGLGLVIARGIVAAHGGKIWVESTGRDETACPGSSFHVLLPLRLPLGLKAQKSN